MFCPKCGKINPDNETVCSGCSALLKEETPGQEIKKGKKLRLVLTVLAVVAVCVVAYLLVGCSPPKENVSF